MNLTVLATDNIAELLVKIIEFTQTRQRVLTQNINNLHEPGFVPRDLEVDTFSGLLTDALNEHIRSRRLLLCDTQNIKFGGSGTFEARPVVDLYAKEMLEQDRHRYLQLQINKLLENTLNQRVAAELLRRKQGMSSIFE